MSRQGRHKPLVLNQGIKFARLEQERLLEEQAHLIADTLGEPYSPAHLELAVRLLSAEELDALIAELRVQKADSDGSY